MQNMPTAEFKLKKLFLILPMLVIATKDCSQSHYIEPSEKVSHHEFLYFRTLIFSRTSFVNLDWNFVLNFLTEGSILPPNETISSHRLEEQAVHMKCYLLCDKQPKCVGINYRMTAMNVENCQLTKTTGNRNTSKTGDWILLHDVERVSKKYFYSLKLIIVWWENNLTASSDNTQCLKLQFSYISKMGRTVFSLSANQ